MERLEAAGGIGTDIRVEGEVLSFYRISPYAAAIIYVDRDGIYNYKVVEPLLVGGEARLLTILKRLLAEEALIGPEILLEGGEKAVKALSSMIVGVLRKHGYRVGAETLKKLLYYLARDLVGYGPIDPIYRDPYVEDITCDGTGIPVYVYHRDYGWLRTNVVFADPSDLVAFARRLMLRAGQDISIAKPIAEGPLPPKGYRVHVTLDVVSRRGATFTIRRFSEVSYTLVDLINFRTLDPMVGAYLWMAVSELTSMLIIGPMAAGKTTMLNAVAMLIPPETKIVTVEETPELRLPHENWVPMVTRPSFEPGVSDITLFDLLKSALRQRPDYIIVGEIRGEEAYTFFQATAVGHGGMATFHAESPVEAIRRLVSPPINIPKSLIPMVKVIVTMRRVKAEEETRRILTDVTEVTGYDAARNQVLLNKVFKWNPVRDSWEISGRSAVMARIAELRGWREERVREELENRAAVLRWAAEKRLSVAEFLSLIREYQRHPERVLEKAKAGGPVGR